MHSYKLFYKKKLTFKIITSSAIVWIVWGFDIISIIQLLFFEILIFYYCLLSLFIILNAFYHNKIGLCL